MLLQYEVMCRRGDHSSRSSFGASPICFDLSRAWVASLVDAYSNKKHTTLKGTAPSPRGSNLRPLLKSEKGSAGVSKSPTSLKSNQQQQKSSASCGGLVVFPRQRPPSRTPQLRRGAPAAAGCERSSAGPCGGRSTLPAHPRPVVSGASSRW